MKVSLKVLLEVHIGERWCPVRIAHNYPNVRAALDSLPVFARQQKVGVDDVRMKTLRTESQLLYAENAIIAYIREQGTNFLGELEGRE